MDGHKTDHVRNSLHEAARASKLLGNVAHAPVTVMPLIVVVSPASISEGRTKPRVKALSQAQLYRWLTRRRQRLSAEAVTYFSMIAEERSTWHTRAQVTDDTLRHVQRFERLQHEVKVAAVRARRWALLASLVLIGGGIITVIAVIAGLGKAFATTIGQ